MSGTFPLQAGFRTTNFSSQTTSRVTVSVSGKTQRIKTGQQFFTFKLKSPKMTRLQVDADFSFIAAQDGQVESFTIVPPVISSSKGTASGTVTVVNATSSAPVLSLAAGSKNVGVSGGSGTLKKGDLIKFSNHDKVYMLTEDANLDGSTVDQLSFYPPLTTALTGGGQTITYNSVPFKVYLNSDTATFSTSTDGLHQYEISVNEEI
tara:strand:+ start:14018 stop:14635 length:618 start_codon:yes stop_codon:yes gene_type:complete